MNIGAPLGVERLHDAIGVLILVGQPKHILGRAFDEQKAFALSAPSITRSSLIFASVSVPVLSVHRTLMAPTSWIADKRFTITFRLAICMAERASATVTTMGSSSGVRPTARATANRIDSRIGRANQMFTTSTKTISATAKRMISMLKLRIPSAKSVAGGLAARLVASRPIADLLLVRQIRMVVVPLMTEVPENTTLEAPPGFFRRRRSR